jgi:hypothetical protein
MITGDFDPSSSYTETIALIRDESNGGFPFVGLFDYSGSLKSMGSKNFSDVFGIIIQGDFLGTGDLDIGIAGETFSGGDDGVHFFSGNDLVYDSFIDFNLYIDDLISGNFNNDEYKDVLINTGYGAVYLYNSDTKSLINALDLGYPLGYDLDIQPLEWTIGNDVDELAINLKHEGLKIMDLNGNTLWSLQFPQLAKESQTRLYIGNWSKSEYNDIIYSNFEYLNLINGTSKEIQGVHVGEGNLHALSLADFDLNTTYSIIPDFSYINDDRLVVVSGNQFLGTLPDTEYVIMEDNNADGVEQNVIFESSWQYSIIGIMGLTIIIPILYNTHQD